MKSAIIILVYMLVAGVLLTGCKTQREHLQSSAQLSEQTDSFRLVERVVVDTIRIARDTTAIQLPFIIYQYDTLVVRDTVFEKTSGRATVKAFVENGRITISAECDSIEKLVLHYDKLIERYRSTNTDLKTETSTSTRTTLPSIKIPLGVNIALAGFGVLAIIWGIKMLRT